MEVVTKTVGATIASFAELSEPDRMLYQAAALARLKAQAPYSGFMVGAAVLSASGRVYVGCNVERCSYTQTTHAEQNAVDAMVASEGPNGILAVAVVAAPAVPSAPAGPSRPVAPCGHCLQILWENCRADRSVRVILSMPDGRIAVMTMADALPFPFGPEALGITYGR